MNDAAPAPAPRRQKELGAFYTPPAIAQILTDWAIRESGDSVLDPSFGGLVFLEAARDRLRRLGAPGGAIEDQLFGVDVDPQAHALARSSEWLRDHHRLIGRDFFSVEPTELPPIDALIGNPPYIRYQAFNGSAGPARELALRAGVNLTRLASSWAPFVVHGTSFVSPGGRFAQVLPAELLQAQYAREVVEFLRREYERVFVAVFDGRIFPGALEDVVLVFADGRGAQGLADVRLVPCSSTADVAEGLREAADAPKRDELLGGGRLLGQLLPVETLQLYNHLSAARGVRRLGEIASVDIGIVTGANNFFVMAEGERHALDPDLLRPAVGKAAQVAGARLSHGDHEDLLRRGQKGLMLVANEAVAAKSGTALRDYVRRGEEDGLHERYKCRIRHPWWALPVPPGGPADLLLTYCSNEHPRLALNDAGVLSTNTIHGVRLQAEVGGSALAAGFYNSLTLLSAELEGRSYGGGVLKLEPTEAEALVLPPLSPEVAAVLPAVDCAIRERDIEAAADLVDPLTLGVLGLDAKDIHRLRAARRQLQMRRRSRGRPPV